MGQGRRNLTRPRDRQWPYLGVLSTENPAPAGTQEIHHGKVLLAGVGWLAWHGFQVHLHRSRMIRRKQNPWMARWGATSRSFRYRYFFLGGVHGSKQPSAQRLGSMLGPEVRAFGADEEVGKTEAGSGWAVAGESGVLAWGSLWSWGRGCRYFKQLTFDAPRAHRLSAAIPSEAAA